MLIFKSQQLAVHFAVLLLSKRFTPIRWDSSVTQHKTAIMRATE
jgi:hypothetical protein